MFKRIGKMGLAVLLGVSMLAGCTGGSGSESGSGTPSESASQSPSGSASATANPTEKLEPVTLKLMFPGERPKDFDAVIAEAERRMADTLNVKLNVVFVPFSDFIQKSQVTLASGEELDMIFDAPWIHLSQMVAADYYEPLDDLLKEHGPDILKNRPAEMLEANKYNGKIMAIPLFNSYFQGRVYYIRKDIREKLGVPPIKTHEELINFAYLVKEKEPDITPIIPSRADMAWAAYQKSFDYDSYMADTHAGMNGVLFLKNNDGKVYNMFDEMDPKVKAWIDEARKLYLDKVIHQDVLSVKDYRDVFKSGKAAIMNSTDFGVNADIANATIKAMPTAEVETVTFLRM